MTDFWSQAGNKAKFFASTLAVIGVLGGWFWSIFVVADDASDALAKTVELEENDKVLESKIDDLTESVHAIETKIEVNESAQKIRDEYQKAQLKRIEQLLIRGGE